MTQSSALMRTRSSGEISELHNPIENSDEGVLWNGRRVLYGVSYALFGTASIEAVGVILNYLAPSYKIIIPPLLVAGFGAGMVVVTLIGGCCLYANVPDQEYENQVKRLRQKISDLTNSEIELKEEIKLTKEKSQGVVAESEILVEKTEKVQQVIVDYQAEAQKKYQEMNNLVETTIFTDDDVKLNLSDF